MYKMSHMKTETSYKDVRFMREQKFQIPRKEPEINNYQEIHSDSHGLKIITKRKRFNRSKIQALNKNL